MGGAIPLAEPELSSARLCTARETPKAGNANTQTTTWCRRHPIDYRDRSAVNYLDHSHMRAHPPREEPQQRGGARKPDPPGLSLSMSQSRRNTAAPQAHSSRNTEKIVEKLAENGRKWRFFERPRRHFAVVRAGCTRLQHALLPAGRYVRRVRLPRSASRPRKWGVSRHSSPVQRNSRSPSAATIAHSVPRNGINSVLDARTMTHALGPWNGIRSVRGW